MATGDIYKLTVIGRSPLQNQLVNTFHFRALQDTVLDTQTEDLIQAFHSPNPWDSYRACFGNSIGLDRIEARQVNGPALEFAELSIVETGAGGAGDHLPNQCAAVISWRTGNIGRSFRGRTYVFPTLETNQANGQWVAGYLTALGTFANNALVIGDGVLEATYELVIWSTISNGAPRVPPIATAVITSKRDIRVFTQRRRVTGVGA